MTMIYDKKQTNSSKEILVSICCLAYNHEVFIRECLDGFLMQRTDFSFEILIHDDASTDDTAKIIKEYESKYPDIIKPIYQLENQYSKGQGGISINYNFPRAKGKYIAMCEGDDYWTDPLKLQKQVDFLENNTSYVLTFHDAVIINGKGEEIAKSKLPENCKKDFPAKELNKGAFLLTLSLCFRNVIKTYPEEMYKVTNGDTFLISLLGQYGKGKYLDNIKPAAYRIHQGGIWSEIDNIKKLKMRLNLFRTLRIYYVEDQELEQFFKGREKGIMRQLMSQYLKKEDWQAFKEISVKYPKTERGYRFLINYFFLAKMMLLRVVIKFKKFPSLVFK